METTVLEFTREGLMVALIVSLPILAVGLFIGLLVSVFQAVTQIQEMTLSYVPKLAGSALIIALLGGWMLQTLVHYMVICLEQAARVSA